MKQEQMWDAYQNDASLIKTHRFDQARVDYVIKRLGKNDKVLNIGVGLGCLERQLVRKNVDVSCLDPSQQSIDRLREHLSLGDKAQVGHAQKIPFPDNTFDTIIMTEVLEHLENDAIDATSSEILRTLKLNGLFIGTVPAEERLSESVIVCPNCQERFHRWGHVQSFGKERLTEVLLGHFSQVTVRRVYFGNLKKLNWKGKVILVFKVMQARLDKTGSNQHFYFEAHNRELTFHP